MWGHQGAISIKNAILPKQKSIPNQNMYKNPIAENNFNIGNSIVEIRLSYIFLPNSISSVATWYIYCKRLEK